MPSLTAEALPVEHDRPGRAKLVRADLAVRRPSATRAPTPTSAGCSTSRSPGRATSSDLDVREDPCRRQGAGVSPLLIEVHPGAIPTLKRLASAPEPIARGADEQEPLEVSLSDLAALRRLRALLPAARAARLPADARARARLRQRRAPRAAPRRRARARDAAAAHDAPSSTASSTTEFFLPVANKAAHRELKASGRRLVDRYSPTTQPSSSGCGRSSARSSCASPTRSSPGAPTSSSTRPTAARRA